jgi:hypothetical protein
MGTITWLSPELSKLRHHPAISVVKWRGDLAAFSPRVFTAFVENLPWRWHIEVGHASLAETGTIVFTSFYVARGSWRSDHWARFLSLTQPLGLMMRTADRAALCEHDISTTATCDVPDVGAGGAEEMAQQAIGVVNGERSIPGDDAVTRLENWLDTTLDLTSH